MIRLGDGGVAVVTGAAGGIGLGIARAAAGAGMAVVLSDIDADRLDAAVRSVAETDGRSAGRVVDVTDRAAVCTFAAETAEEYGRVDLVCNNAGMTLVRPVTELTEADWRRVVDLNLYGVVNGIAAFLPIMEEQGFGHLNATASANGFRGDPFQAPYNATKHAVVGLMESVVLDLRELGSPVTASVLSPGPIATDIMTRAIGDDDEFRDEVHGLLGRGMDPDEAGRIALDGIKAGRVWIFTHQLIFDTIRRRYEAMMADGSLPPDLDWPWEEMLSPP